MHKQLMRKILNQVQDDLILFKTTAQGNYTDDIDALSISFPPATETTKTGNRTTLTYAWGACWMDPRQTACKNEQLGIYYHAYYEHITDPRKRECTAKIAMSIPTQICKQETGKDTPFYTDSTWAAYAY